MAAPILGDLLYRAASLWTRLAGNITTTRKFLRQTGTGAASAVPAWDTLVAGDLPNTAVTPGSYTSTDLTVDAQGRITAASNGTPGGGGTVTNTGTLTANALVIGNGGVDVKVTTTGTGVVTALGVNVGTSGAPVVLGGVGSMSAYVNLQDQQAQNTNGGTFTSGAWRTRVLNTEVSDVGGLCSLASNQFTLTAGTYIISASAPAAVVVVHQTRLQNITDTATILVGTSELANGTSASSRSLIHGIFTIGASKALELQHQCNTTRATDGMGVACNFTTEVYAVVELWKIG